MPSTYTPIATATATGQSSYTFSSIPSTYTDLVLVINASISGTGVNLGTRYNGDTGNNYSFVRTFGAGGSAQSSTAANVPDNYIGDISTTMSTTIVHIPNYSNTTTYKTALSRANDTSSSVQLWINLWRSTAAINSITVYGTGTRNYASGSTFTLYGIKAA
jgi:hypothetical protein